MSPEGFPTGPEETPDILQQRAYEEERERSAEAEMSTERTDIVGGTHEFIGDLQENTERTQAVQELLGEFEGLEDNEGNIIPGFDVFSQYILQAPADIQEAFIDFETSLIFEESVRNSAHFPVNDFEFQASIIEGGNYIEAIALAEEREVAAEEREVAAEEREVAAEEREVVAEERENQGVEEEREIMEGEIERAERSRENILGFRDSLSGINISPELSGLLSQLEEGEISIENAENIIALFRQITAYLSSSQEIEETILPQARASGNYDTVRSSLITLGGGNSETGGIFEQRILAWELGEEYTITQLPPEQQIRTSAALGTDVQGVADDAEQTGNIFTIETETGEEITYDVVTNERSLSVDGYSIPSQVEDTGDYQTPKLEYMRVEQEALPRLQKIAAAAEAISEAMFDSEEVDSIKETLRESLGFTYYTELGLDAMETAAELKTAIQSAYRENTERLEEARDTYRETLEGLRDAHMGALERRDRKVRETLRFLESIGFTDIPQYITDQIIDTLNSNSGLRRQVGFTEEIDFSNGQLGTDYSQDGESLDGSIPLADRQRFAEIINRMIGVVDENGNPPINVGAIGTTSVPVGDDTRFMGLLNDSGLLNVGGIGVAMENLQTRPEQG